MLKTFTVRWSPEREEKNTIDGVEAVRIVSDYEVEDSEGKPILVEDASGKPARIHGTIAITPGPNRKQRIEETMLACAKGVERLLVERGLFSLAPSTKSFGLDVKEG